MSAAASRWYQEAHCREAVMWWVHHLAEEKRQEFRRQNLTVAWADWRCRLELGWELFRTTEDGEDRISLFFEAF